MPHPCPHHCPGGRGGVPLLAVLAVVVSAVLARPVVHAAETVLEVAAITVGIAADLAVAAAAVLLAVRARHRAALPGHPLTARTAQRLSVPRPRAIEPPPRIVRGEDDATGVTRQANEYRS